MRLQQSYSTPLVLILIQVASIFSLKAERGLGAQSQISQRSSIPEPIVVPPSQSWDGDDGQWSSFGLRVGNPVQNVRVLVSTNSQNTFVVVPQGCTTDAIDPVPLQCAKDRGQLFNPNKSTTWRGQGTFGINGDGVGLEANLGYSLAAAYGLETVGLGHVAGDINGPTLENQTVASIAARSPFYTGVLGLGTQPINYTSLGNFSTPSYFVSLRDQNLIPSLSWSYTAGARYQLKAGQPAQLIFGGYDSSRFSQNSVNFTLADDVTRDIVVAVQSISYTGTTQEVLLSKPIYAFIESTDPNFWLPLEAVQAFEKAFGISADNGTGLYLINSSQYATLSAVNPSVTFTLANSAAGGQTVDIVLPFNAFILRAAFPFAPNATSYFPLRLAANETQYTLGRTFLQEAYLTVNYDSGMFSVSQCAWNDGAVPLVIPLLSNSSSTGSEIGGNATGKLPSETSSGLGAGSTAGVAVGVIGGVGLIGAAVFFLLRRRKQRRSISPTGTEPRATTISPDHTSTTNVVMKVETNTDTWDVSKYREPVLSPHSLHRARSELSAVSDAPGARELPAEDNRDGRYSTDDQRMRSLRKAHRTPELDSADFYELDGGPVPDHLSRVTEKELEGSTPTSPFDLSSSTGQRSDNGVSPIDSIRTSPLNAHEQQNSWLDMSPRSLPSTTINRVNQSTSQPGGLVSPMAPFRGNIAQSRFNTRESSRVGGPVSSNWSERSDRSTRSTRSDCSDSDLYSTR